MNWNLNSIGGDLVGSNGDTFLQVFKGTTSLSFIHKDEPERLVAHRKHCLEHKVVENF